MRKVNTVLTLLVATTLSCNGQTNRTIMQNDVELELIKMPVSIGLGTLDIATDPYTLTISSKLLPVPLYRTENDETPIDTLTFRKDEDGVWYFETKNLQSLKPYDMFGGLPYEQAQQVMHVKTIKPSVLKFRVLETTDQFYRVVIDESSFETVFIRKDPDYFEWSGDAFSLQQRLSTLRMRLGIKGYHFYETWEQLLLRAVHIYFKDNNIVIYDAPDGKQILKEKQTVFYKYKVTEVRDSWAKIQDIREAEGDVAGWVKWNDGKKMLVRIMEYYPSE